MSLKQRFNKALRKKAARGFSGYPVATVAYYGPNNKLATKVAVGIVLAEDLRPAFLERWFSEGDLRNDPKLNEQILKFIRSHEAKSVVIGDRILGCPHEEGIDYPQGSACPQCPFWATVSVGAMRPRSEWFNRCTRQTARIIDEITRGSFKRKNPSEYRKWLRGPLA